MAKEKIKPISKRQPRWLALMLAAKLADPSPHIPYKTSYQTPNDIAARLAADRAQGAADLRLNQQPDDLGNETSNDENIADDSNDTNDTVDNEQQGQSTDERETNTTAGNEIPGQIYSDRNNPFMHYMPKMGSGNQTKNSNTTPETLNDEQQTEAAADMEGNKQRQLAQIAQQEAKLEKELSELEGSLTNFKNGKVLKGLFLSGSRITFLIDRLVEEAKKPIKNLDDKAKAKKIQALILMMEALIAMLRGLKLLTALVDALFLHSLSTLRMILFTLPTIILPIIIFILFPIWVPFLGIFFWIGKIPLLKGPLTQPVNELVDTLKKQKDSWKKELKKINKKISIREQLKKLAKAKKQIQIS